MVKSGKKNKKELSKTRNEINRLATDHDCPTHLISETTRKEMEREYGQIGKNKPE